MTTGFLSNTKIKTVVTIAILFFLCAGMNRAEAKRLNAFMSYTTFSSPESGPFIETYLVVAGNSVQFKLNENNKYQASI